MFPAYRRMIADCRRIVVPCGKNCQPAMKIRTEILVVVHEIVQGISLYAGKTVLVFAVAVVCARIETERPLQARNAS